MKKFFIKYLTIIFACGIYSVGIGLFLDPNNLAPGGITGIAIIVNYVTGINTGLLVFAINIPIMLAAIFKFGYKMFLSTIFALSLSSVFIYYLSELKPLTTDPILACAAGALLVSCGIGLIFRVGATTGGADILVKFIKLKFKHIKTGVLFLVFDGIVVAVSGVVFGTVDIALYAGISVFLQAYILNLVLYGTDGARVVYIISGKSHQIAQRLLKELDTGVTYLSGKGGFTGNDKEILFCALKKQSVPAAKSIVKETDDEAFVIITTANQVFGEGYKLHDSEEL